VGAGVVAGAPAVAGVAGVGVGVVTVAVKMVSVEGMAVAMWRIRLARMVGRVNQTTILNHSQRRGRGQGH